MEYKLILNGMSMAKYLFLQPKWLDKIIYLRKLFSFEKYVQVRMVKSTEELSNLIGHSVPDWVIGTYTGNCILMLDCQSWKTREQIDFCQVFVHEFIHVLTQYTIRSLCPIWLNEGLAVYLSEQLKSINIIPKEVTVDDVYTMDYSSENLYGISGLLVAGLTEKYGLESLIHRLAAVSNFESDEILGIDNIHNLWNKLIS